MADDLKQTGKPDDSRINVDQEHEVRFNVAPDHEVRYWAGVSDESAPGGPSREVDGAELLAAPE